MASFYIDDVRCARRCICISTHAHTRMHARRFRPTMTGRNNDVVVVVVVVVVSGLRARYCKTNTYTCTNAALYFHKVVCPFVGRGRGTVSVNLCPAESSDRTLEIQTRIGGHRITRRKQRESRFPWLRKAYRPYAFCGPPLAGVVARTVVDPPTSTSNLVGTTGACRSGRGAPQGRGLKRGQTLDGNQTTRPSGSKRDQLN